MQKYTWPAIILHWLMAPLVIGMLGLGLYMADLPAGDLRSELIGLHKSIGLTLAVLFVIRLGWRASQAPPPYPGAMPDWQRRVARANVLVLYALLFLQPLSGYLSSSFSGYATRVFGLALPQWGWEAPELNRLFNFFHTVFGRALIVFIALHLAGAALHGIVRRDGVVRRMLP